MRTNGVNRSEPLLSMFSEQTIDEETRHDLMAELFPLVRVSQGLGPSVGGKPRYQY